VKRDIINHMNSLSQDLRWLLAGFFGLVMLLVVPYGGVANDYAEQKKAVWGAIKSLGVEPSEERMQFANGLVSPLFIAYEPEEPTPGGTYSDVLAWVFFTKEEARSAFEGWVKKHLTSPQHPMDDRLIYDRSESINLLKDEQALILVSSSEGEVKGYFLCGTVLGEVSQGSWPSTDLKGDGSKEKKGVDLLRLSDDAEKAVRNLMSRFAEALIARSACQSSIVSTKHQTPSLPDPSGYPLGLFCPPKTTWLGGECITIHPLPFPPAPPSGK
jgi:hypothetical protein